MNALLVWLFIAAYIAAGPRAFVLAGERVDFDANLLPRFSAKQVSDVPPEIRAGFARWAGTPAGHALIARFDIKEYEIVVAEDAGELGAGRAPQPALATLVAARDHAARKSYALILNPEFRLAKGKNVFPSAQPSTQSDMMAAAWAGEMLHIDFYSRGISLPHHGRADFQEEWRRVARELGYPNMKHEDDEERPAAYAGTH